MKRTIAWTLIMTLAATWVAGCQKPAEEPVAQEPGQKEPVPVFPEDQVPVAEPQPVASPPVDTSVTPSKTKPQQIISQPMPKENYAPPKKADRYHVVRKGDTLQKISRKYYGTNKKWRDIYNVNREVLNNGPDKLQVGMKLVIP